MHLHPPSPRYRESFLAAVAEFQAEGLPWWSGAAIELAAEDFEAFVQSKLDEATRETDERPFKTHLWTIEDNAFVGRIAIFHHLTPALEVSGGHIGYDVRPSFRCRGLATEMLRRALPVAWELGLSRVLLTCDASNLASQRVIERNAGVRDTTRATDDGKLAYWISK